MKPIKIVAVLLLAAGVWVLAQGGFTFGKSKETAKIGSLEFSVSKKERVAVPQWAGIAAIVVGAGLLLVPGRR
jgi:hypothetical protein